MEKRIHPAIDISRSGTRREDLLIEPELLRKIWMDPAQAAAPDGRDRGDGVPAGQDEEHKVQRRVLQLDEALTCSGSRQKKPRDAGLLRWLPWHAYRPRRAFTPP